MTNCPSFSATYWPFFLSGVLHSLLGVVFPLPPKILYKRQSLILSDGGTISLDWHSRTDIPKYSDVIVLILPGFESGSQAPYIRRCVASLRDFQCVVLNFRGYSQPITSGKYHNLSSTEDMKFAIEYLIARNPTKKFVAIGFSMGANMLLKYLAEEAKAGNSIPFLCAVSASNPFDLQALYKYHYSNSKIKNFAYDIWHFVALYQLKRKIKRYAELFKDKVDMNAVMTSRSLLEFADRFSAQIYGLESGDEYLRRASCINFLRRQNDTNEHWEIPIPVLVVTATDDPLVPASNVPWDITAWHSNVILLSTKCGGHLGWLTISLHNWLNPLLNEFIQAVLLKTHATPNKK